MNPAHRTIDFFGCMREVSADCHSVLEPGCQMGAQLKLVNRSVMTGIEVHKPFLDKAWAPKHVKYIHADARIEMKRIAEENPKSFDGVMMIDFIEHLEKAEAYQMIEWAERIAKKRVWIWTPEGWHPQDKDDKDMGADYWQTHRSTWYAPDLEQLGYDVAVWAGHFARKACQKPPGFESGAMFAVKDLAPPPRADA